MNSDKTQVDDKKMIQISQTNNTSNQQTKKEINN